MRFPKAATERADDDNKGSHITGGQFSGGHAVTVGMLRLYCGRLESRYFEAPSPEEKE
jgi:hypothetical protein